MRCVGVGETCMRWSECECIQPVRVTEGAAGYSEMFWEWTHSLHMAKQSTATSTGGFVGAFITYPHITLRNVVRHWNHIVVFETIRSPHCTEAILRIPLCTYHQSSRVIAMFFQEGRWGLCYSVYIILSDFTERCEGGRYGQVNGIVKIYQWFHSFPVFFQSWFSKEKGCFFHTQTRLIVKLIFSSN